jgi:predicted PurR-regulated permease PerM
MVGWRILLWAVLVLAALIFLYLVRGILLPFAVAFIVASLLEPAVRRLRMKGLSRRTSVLIVLGIFGVFVIGLTAMVAPTVASQISALTTKAETLTNSISQVNQTDNFFVDWNPLIEVQDQGTATDDVDQLLATYGGALERFGIPATRQGLIQRFVQPNQDQIARFVQGSVQSFYGFLTNLPSEILFVFLTPLLTLMILLDMENFKRRSPRWIPPAIRASMLQIFDDIGQVFFKYLRGISTVVLLYAGAQTLVMLVLQVPYAFLLGALFGALYLIPYIGNVISAVTVLTVVGLSEVHGNMLFEIGGFGSLPPAWSYGLIAMGVYLSIGLVFDHLIYPQLVGNSVGLSPVVSLFVIFCGEALFGLPGMIIAFPLAGSVKVILDRLLKVTSTSSEGLNLPVVPLRHRSA